MLCLEFRQELIQIDNSLGVLGVQLQLALSAYAKPEEEHACSVLGDRVPGSLIFTGGKGKRRYMQYERLPPSPYIKAIGVDDNTLFIELSPLDLERLKKADMPEGIRFELDRHQVWHTGKRRRKIAWVSNFKDNERWLWMVEWSRLPQDNLDAAIGMLDRFLEDGLFQGKKQPPRSPHSAEKPLEKRLGMQLELIQEQVPELMLNDKLTQSSELNQGMTQELQLQQLQRFERWLSRNPVEAIQDALDKDDSPEGQARLVKFIEFKMARDVREAAKSSGREIAWSEARQIVRKLMRR
ncbi:hypothetical protein IT407_00895 [Candidatus Uhrbacteria bacterium]|nr:hypothetical protein [Candidatus Uhrbacteria bacterium]